MSCTQSPGDATIPVCLGVGHLRVEQGWYHTAHSHGFHQIMVMAGGCLAVMAGEAQVQAQPGDVLCYPSGVRHAERAADPGGAEFTYLAFQAHLEPCPSVVQDPTGRGLALARWLHGRAGNRSWTGC